MMLSAMKLNSMMEASVRGPTYSERRRSLASVLLFASALVGCAEEARPPTSGGAGGSGGGGASSGGGGAGGGNGGFTQGGGGTGGTPVCVSTSEKAEPTPLDIIFVIDWSQSMQGASWQGSTSALETFLTEPASAGISAGMVYFPTIKPFFENTCDTQLYKVLDVPIAPLPGNAFSLVNSFPADAVGAPSPLYAGLVGALQAATAQQDANPTHKVIVVMASDGGYNTCGYGIDAISGWARNALEYNGVRTYTIAVQAAQISFDNLEQIAIEGGTDVVYDASDISEFSTKIAEIRAAALGCDFTIPAPPSGQDLVPDEVNFTYAPGGSDTPITLPRADNLADCGDQPGWYYDNNLAPTKIIVCPASCTTIQNDTEAEVAVAFGCASIPN